MVNVFIVYYVNGPEMPVIFTVCGSISGSDSCQWLLSDGHFQGYNEWQPFGCMMHQYSKR